MICSLLTQTIGFECEPLSDDGSISMIRTPFTFQDGEPLPVFVESNGKQLRFFDDGVTLLHFRGRGVRLQDNRNLRAIKNIAEPQGLELNTDGELEVWTDVVSAPAAFAKFMSTLLAVTSWERGLVGVSTDITLFLDEVEMCLRNWRPTAHISETPVFSGITGTKYKLDFLVDEDAVVAVAAHPNSVSAAAKKLLDIRASNENENLKIIIVLDDRMDAETAHRDGLILDSLGNVMMMSRFEKNIAGSAALPN